MPRLVPVHWRKLEKVLLAKGFSFDGQEGSHRKYSKRGVRRPLILPRPKEVPPSIIANNLRTAGISLEEYFQLLDKI